MSKDKDGKEKKSKIDIDKIAKNLGAVRRGKVRSGAGYFGALQTAADVAEIKKSKKKN